jgi:hypothetical protein
MRAHEALKRQTGLATTRGNRCDVCALDIRQQATDRGCGVLIVSLTMEDGDKGLQKGGQAWDDLLENLRSDLTCVKQWGCAKGVSRFHGTLLL